MSTADPADEIADYGDPIIPVAVVTIALSTMFIGLRIWSRAVILRVWALEDWILLCGWLCAVGVCAGNIRQLEYGLGRSFSTFSPENTVKYLQTGVTINFFYVFALTFVKISILFLYLRAFTYPFVIKASKALLGIVIITHLWIIISVATTCVPLNALWDPAKRPTAYCHPFSVWWSHAGINIATDFLIFALPLTVFRKMRVPRRQKTALYFVFGLGFCVCLISVVRALQFINGITTADQQTVIIGCWNMLEVHLPIMCSCLTTIKPVLAPLLPWIYSQPSRESTDLTELETIGHARRARQRLDSVSDHGGPPETMRDVDIIDTRGKSSVAESRRSTGGP
ncbi:hypothetical protein OQA88_7220 [Cercophora sp. LCS_1]